MELCEAASPALYTKLIHAVQESYSSGSLRVRGSPSHFPALSPILAGHNTMSGNDPVAMEVEDTPAVLAPTDK
jgi:hypothetical protein